MHVKHTHHANTAMNTVYYIASVCTVCYNILRMWLRLFSLLYTDVLRDLLGKVYVYTRVLQAYGVVALYCT